MPGDRIDVRRREMRAEHAACPPQIAYLLTQTEVGRRFGARPVGASFRRAVGIGDLDAAEPFWLLAVILTAMLRSQLWTSRSFMPENASVEVLVVDDDILLRLDMSDQLQRRGFAVLRARDADQAIRIMETHPGARAVLCDQQMPGSMKGPELLHVISNRWPGRRLVLVTGYNSPRAEELPPGTQFLSKPVSRRSLDLALEGLQPDVEQ